MPTLIIYAVLAVAALGILGGITYKVRQGGYDACKVEWSQAAADQAKREQEASAKAAAALAEERKKRKVVIKEVTSYVDKIVERPVYRNVCLDDAGLRCLESAISGKVESGCKPDGTVPATGTAEGKGR